MSPLSTGEPFPVNFLKENGEDELELESDDAEEPILIDHTKATIRYFDQRCVVAYIQLTTGYKLKDTNVCKKQRGCSICVNESFSVAATDAINRKYTCGGTFRRRLITEWQTALV